MEISLYNNTGVNVYANINGIEYIIKPECTSVARCNEVTPVTITLSRKQKSFALLNLFDFDNGIDWDWFESTSFLVLNSIYVLNINGSDNQYFKISSETFNCDKYYQYDRLYLDDPLIKNDCTYEITRQKQIKKRVKLFNIYTPFIAFAVVFAILTFVFDLKYIKAGTFFTESNIFEELLFGMVISLVGICGRLRIKRRYKKVTDEEYIQACFRGYIEEIK